MFSITKTAADKNGLASLTNGILTNEEINLDTAMRTSIQNEVPGISRTVEIPGNNERVGINSLRKGNKKNPDLNRVYANNLDVDVNRQLFVGCSAADGGISAFSPVRKKSSSGYDDGRPNSVCLPSSPHTRSPARKKRPTSAVDPLYKDLLSPQASRF